MPLTKSYNISSDDAGNFKKNAGMSISANGTKYNLSWGSGTTYQFQGLDWNSSTKVLSGKSAGYTNGTSNGKSYDVTATFTQTNNKWRISANATRGVPPIGDGFQQTWTADEP